MNEFTIVKKIIWLGGNAHVTGTTQPVTEVTLWTNAHVTSEK
jgi:inosine-uridine nucleoside N-ribohydrolase